MTQSPAPAKTVVVPASPAMPKPVAQQVGSSQPLWLQAPKPLNTYCTNGQGCDSSSNSNLSLENSVRKETSVTTFINKKPEGSCYQIPPGFVKNPHANKSLGLNECD